MERKEKNAVVKEDRYGMTQLKVCDAGVVIPDGAIYEGCGCYSCGDGALLTVFTFTGKGEAVIGGRKIKFSDLTHIDGDRKKEVYFVYSKGSEFLFDSFLGNEQMEDLLDAIEDGRDITLS